MAPTESLHDHLLKLKSRIVKQHLTERQEVFQDACKSDQANQGFSCLMLPWTGEVFVSRVSDVPESQPVAGHGLKDVRRKARIRVHGSRQLRFVAVPKMLVMWISLEPQPEGSP